MWSLYHRAKALSNRPSQLLEVEDSLAAYLLDGAVITLGVVMENALQDMVEVGSDSDKKRIPRYTLSQILDPEFYLPREGKTSVAPSKISGTSDGGIVVDSV
jgi:hypothetical protein